MLRCVLCPRWHGMSLVNKCRDAFFCPGWHARCLVNTFSDTLCVLAGMVCVCSTHAEIYFVSLLAWYEFGQRMLRWILCSRWHGLGLVNSFYDTFCVLVGMVCVLSMQVEIHFVSLLSWEGFSLSMLIWIFRPCGIGGVWSTHVIAFCVIADNEEF